MIWEKFIYKFEILINNIGYPKWIDVNYLFYYHGENDTCLEVVKFVLMYVHNYQFTNFINNKLSTIKISVLIM